MAVVTENATLFQDTVLAISARIDVLEQEIDTYIRHNNDLDDEITIV